MGINEALFIRQWIDGQFVKYLAKQVAFEQIDRNCQKFSKQKKMTKGHEHKPDNPVHGE